MFHKEKSNLVSREFIIAAMNCNTLALQQNFHLDEYSDFLFQILNNCNQRYSRELAV